MDHRHAEPLHLQVALLRGVSYISFFRYTLGAFIRLQYAERDDGCGLMPAVTPQQQQAMAAAVQVCPHLCQMPRHCVSVSR